MQDLGLGELGDRRLDKGAFLLSRSVVEGPRPLWVRRLGGDRAGEIRLTRVLCHPAVRPEFMMSEASALTAERCRGRDVLALSGYHGAALDRWGRHLPCTVLWPWMPRAAPFLGLIDANFLQREAGRRVPRRAKPIEEKESFRWLEGADQAAKVCARARSLTVIADREKRHLRGVRPAA